MERDHTTEPAAAPQNAVLPVALPAPRPAAAHRFNNDLRYRTDAHPNQVQLTPAYALDPIRAALGGTIGLDPCTEPDNPTEAERFYTPPTDGCAEPWDAQAIFVNPPYSRAKDRWVRRCMEAADAGATVALLIPAHPDTRIFQAAVEHADSVTFVRGRLKFGIPRENRRQVAASHPSAVFLWNGDPAPLAKLGAVMIPSRPAQKSLGLVVA